MFLNNKIYVAILSLTLGLSVISSPIVNAKKIAAEPAQKEQTLKLNEPMITNIEIAPGLTEKIYKVLREDGPVTAYFLEADRAYYNIVPALDSDVVPGRKTVSQIANEHGAIAAVNASYFSVTGEILGVTKINEKTAGTTYYKRTALGIDPNGLAHIDKISYEGYVTLGDVSLPVSGVDCECGENGLVVHNSLYGKYTNSNQYVMSYVVQDNRVVDISQGNVQIPENGFVVTAHGASIDAFKGLQVGDYAEFYEPYKSPWDEDIHIIGAGPQLVRYGKVNLTVAEERFPADIRYGRNPRSGFAITRDGNYLFAVVDGRQPRHSKGVTLTEFAQMFLDMGAEMAMNFDGGGSSALFINGHVVNSPSDGQERRVGSALLLMPKEDSNDNSIVDNSATNKSTTDNSVADNSITENSVTDSSAADDYIMIIH